MSERSGGSSTPRLVFLAGCMGVGFPLLCLAAVAGAVGLKWRKDTIEACRPRDLVPAVVALRTLDAGEPIGADDVVVRWLDPRSVPQGDVFTTLEPVVGRTPIDRILPNELVRTERFEITTP